MLANNNHDFCYGRAPRIELAKEDNQPLNSPIRRLPRPFALEAV